MFITPSFKKRLIVEQFQGNYLKGKNRVIFFNKNMIFTYKKRKVKFELFNFLLMIERCCYTSQYSTHHY